MAEREDASFIGRVGSAAGATAGSMTDQTRYRLEYDARKKSVLITYLLWFFLGWLGVHRFYLGRITSALAIAALGLIGGGLTIIGVGYLLLGLAAVWLFLDIFLIPGMVSDYNARLIEDLR
jgi:TM2 domain-containing membrane protein YozV